ncbi:MAG: LysM peptidoglycan-binding domain-containing protein, partial [Hydrogenobacter sp.]
MKKEVLVLGISTFLGIAYGVECEYYKVQKGDTLDGIAKRKGVSVQEILKNNKHIAPKKLKAGDKICIPVAEKPKAKKEAKAKKEQDYEYYTVQKGARLKDIANKLGVPLKELEALNPEYKNKFLAKGTKIKVPKREAKRIEKEEEGNYEFYTVERSGKLEHISKKLGIPLKTLEKLNPEYKGVWLKKGTKVKVPKTAVQKQKEKEE